MQRRDLRDRGQGTSSGISIPGGLVRANSATNGRGQPYTPYSISFLDSVSWTRGSHNIKFGGEVRMIRLYTNRLGGTTYTFSNLAGFLANTPQSVQYVGDLSDPSPFNNGLTGERLAEQEYYIGYGQDEGDFGGLTLSYGMRYEYYAPPANETQSVLFDIDSGRSGIRASRRSNVEEQFGPRVALHGRQTRAVPILCRRKDGITRRDRTLLRPGATEDQTSRSRVIASQDDHERRFARIPCKYSGIVSNSP